MVPAWTDISVSVIVCLSVSVSAVEALSFPRDMK